MSKLRYAVIILCILAIGTAIGLFLYGYINGWGVRDWDKWCQKYKDVESPPLQCREFIE